MTESTHKENSTGPFEEEKQQTKEMPAALSEDVQMSQATVVLGGITNMPQQNLHSQPAQEQLMQKQAGCKTN